MLTGGHKVPRSVWIIESHLPCPRECLRTVSLTCSVHTAWLALIWASQEDLVSIRETGVGRQPDVLIDILHGGSVDLIWWAHMQWMIRLMTLCLPCMSLKIQSSLWLGSLKNRDHNQSYSLRDSFIKVPTSLWDGVLGLLLLLVITIIIVIIIVITTKIYLIFYMSDPLLGIFVKLSIILIIQTLLHSFFICLQMVG